MPATFENGKIKLTEGSVADKTHSLCRNAAIVLEAAGSSLEKAVKVTVRPYYLEPGTLCPLLMALTDDALVPQVFFANMDDFAEMNEVYAEYFPQKPARSAIEAKRLPMNLSMEMELIALA